MKACPHCEAEIRDSVIRCTHCGRSLVDSPREEAVDLSEGSAGETWAATHRTSTRPFATATAPPPSPWATRPASDPTPRLPNLATRRALPAPRRAWGPDVWMLGAGVAAVACGVLAYLAVGERWVHLTIIQMPTEVDEGRILQLTLRGETAFVGTAGTALAIAFAVFGGVWFLFGLQRGWTMPGIANPALAILVALAGIGTAFLSSTVWYVWETAMVERARRAGLSMAAMRDLLDRQPNPRVEIERLSGLTTFGGMMALGLVVACFGWWAYRRREG
jgi:hypothetical protein